MNEVITGKTRHMSNSRDSSGCFAGVWSVLPGREILSGTSIELLVSHQILTQSLSIHVYC